MATPNEKLTAAIGGRLADLRRSGWLYLGLCVLMTACAVWTLIGIHVAVTSSIAAAQGVSAGERALMGFPAVGMVAGAVGFGLLAVRTWSEASTLAMAMAVLSQGSDGPRASWLTLLDHIGGVRQAKSSEGGMPQ